MSRQKFEECNRLANINLNNGGQLLEFSKAYILLGQRMGKEQVALEAISELPPENSLNNKVVGLDAIVSMCEETLSNMKSVEISAPSMGAK